MSESQVTPEEVASLSEGDGSAPEGVRPRDFREPLRLSAERLEEVRLDLGARLAKSSAALRPWLRALCPLELESVSETRFPDLLRAGAGGDVCAMSFRVASGETGWVLWEMEPAAVAIDRALGAGGETSEEEEGEANAEAEAASTEEDEAGEPEKRVLTSVEGAVLGEMLGVLLGELLQPFGLEASQFELLQTREQVEFSADANRGGDLQRLHARLHFDGPGGESALRLLIPGLGLSANDANASATASLLPDHLEEVPLSLAAVLGTIEVPLSGLLGLEVGDVIPLDTRAGALLDLVLEGEEPERIALGRLGKSEGRLAVRLEQGPATLPSTESTPSPESASAPAPAPAATSAATSATAPRRAKRS